MTITPSNQAQVDTLQQALDRVRNQQRKLQGIVEPIIERHVATVLQEEGFGTLGQIVPPVSFRFTTTPDVLIVSPRNQIVQDYNISLEALSIEQRTSIEANVEAVSPTDSAYVTGVGGVGIWPSMVIETRWAAIAYEIVSHEWAHHYLFGFPLGLEYLVRPETRFINETVATIFGNAMALQILERFYADEVAQGIIWIPDYPTLQDFLLPSTTTAIQSDPIPTARASTASYLQSIDRPQAAQLVLDVRRRASPQHYGTQLQNPDMVAFQPQDRGVTINRTRITTDYLLQLGHIDAAEALMDTQAQVLGMRVLNQAWFAFNGGYQAAPSSGAGVAASPIVVDVTDPTYVGDPIGPAVHELAVLAPTLEDFLIAVRNVTTRAELLDVLIDARQRWGAAN